MLYSICHTDTIDGSDTMLKILLADDDQVAINGIRLLLSKKNYDLEILEARNGQIALDLLQETPIDILFTDVDMPLVNGIQLAQKAQQLYPAVKIIFFSAYSDFAYAQSAIHLNAVSYLLKPIQPTEFYEVIDHTIRLCQKEASEIIMARELDYLNNLSAKRDMELYLSDLFFNCEMETDTTLPVFPDLTGDSDAVIQFVFLRSNLPLLTTQRKSFESLLEKISNVPMEFYAISGSYGIITLDLSRDRKLLLDWDAWWQAFKRGVCQVNRELILLVIRTKPVSAMPEMISEMRAIRRLLQLNYYIQETTLIRTEYNANDDATSFQIDRIMEDMQETISRKEFHLLSEKLHTLTTALLYNHAYSSLYVKHLLLSIVQEIEKQIPKEYAFSAPKIKSAIAEAPSLLHAEEILQKMMQDLEDMQKQQFSSDNRYVHQIQTIILSDCSSDIVLSSLAERINLSVPYMCNLFKKETGVSIGQYIKNVRMDKAKELLRNTNLRLNDIYPKVGYSSLTYFCIAFKEAFGVTPTQFRQQETT